MPCRTSAGNSRVDNVESRWPVCGTRPEIPFAWPGANGHFDGRQWMKTTRKRAAGKPAAKKIEARKAIAKPASIAGAKIARPETCVIDPGVKIGRDTVIEPYVQLLGRTAIGSGCRIRSFSVIENCVLGNGVLVRPSCILEDSRIADNAEIGPFVHLRPGCEIGEKAHLGNFVEMKKTRVGKGAKANHLSYLGDAEIGEGANIGAGTITCNYDGVGKYRTQIGKGVFVGSDSNLVAPIVIGDGAYIGAGSCITKDVPSDALAIGRARQVNKEGWAAVRRARLAATASTK
jgi:bifunctional UDP-N-acetylglucosamine pyrophosphorylase / glucosamine-1-phosphate N-acetyltransferase